MCAASLVALATAADLRGLPEVARHVAGGLARPSLSATPTSSWTSVHRELPKPKRSNDGAHALASNQTETDFSKKTIGQKVCQRIKIDTEIALADAGLAELATRSNPSNVRPTGRQRACSCARFSITRNVAEGGRGSARDVPCSIRRVPHGGCGRVISGQCAVRAHEGSRTSITVGTDQLQTGAGAATGVEQRVKTPRTGRSTSTIAAQRLKSSAPAAACRSALDPSVWVAGPGNPWQGRS